MTADQTNGERPAVLNRRKRAARKGKSRKENLQPPLELEIKSFADFAQAELAELQANRFGVCALPQCSVSFNPMKPDQVFCSDQCRVAHVTELRKVGHKAAAALLAMREGKYAPIGSPEHRLFKRAWAYLGQLGTAWKSDRERRRREAEARNG